MAIFKPFLRHFYSIIQRQLISIITLTMLLHSLYQKVNHLRRELLIAFLVNCYFLYISYPNPNIKLYYKAKFIKTNQTNHMAMSINYSNIHFINKSLHYILLWYPSKMSQNLLPEKQDVFTDNKCTHTNCFVTYDKNYLKDIRDYDSIIFSGCSTRAWRSKSDFPEKRALRQKYVFATLESSVLCPVTNPIYDDFFNWTWTFRLNSDVGWKYLSVFDTNGSMVGPAVDVKWQTNFKPITEDLKIKLNRKTKALAWFVSHCETSSGREKFVKELKKESVKYGWSVDEYGLCSHRQCKSIWCYKMLQKKYHFYFSAENSFNEDYVTEKLLVPLHNLVVPVVYGGANYSRFLPPGSYLNARALGPEKLAKTMNDLMKNKTLYYKLFEWKNHYKYVSGGITDVCNLCKALNDKDMMIKESTHDKFRMWWNGPKRQKIYDVMLDKFVEEKALQMLALHYNFTREGSKVLWTKIANQSKQPILLNKLNTGA